MAGEAAAPAMIQGRLKEVSENQCTMCMPVGGVVAFKGIGGAMVLIHGSQGCSTYMRLFNVGHFNEPVDIASSSLNEKQTIHGGEANLTKAMDNVIRVYQPKVLGVLTTCLAETMGEDIDRIVTSYIEEKKIAGIDIIPVPTPSYGGTHTEGYWAAVRGIVAYYARPAQSHRRINVIVPNISPADIREIKRILRLMGLEYTLLPDISMTLDRPFGGKYQKIPAGGTQTAAIAEVTGAPVTIQFGSTCPDSLSPGMYLEEEYKVPLVNLPLPIGLKNTDLFIETLHKISGNPVPDELVLDRGWLMDAMADAHKYDADGVPAVYGEPELVYALTSFLAENGAMPAVIATGSKNSLLAKRLEPVTANADTAPVLIDEADFAAIEDAAIRAGANIAIGHSGGKMLDERHGLPLLRIGYPIHDRMGGQRILSVGYRGTLALLDSFTNTLLSHKYATYRRKIRQQLCTPEGM